MMKKNFIVQLMLIASSITLFTDGLFAQGVYNNGGKIVIGSGVTFTIGGAGGNYRNETNVTDGSIDLSGTLEIAGNVTNNAVADLFSSEAAGSTVILSGTTLQTLGGTTASGFTFPNLTVNNSGGIVLAKNTQVNGTLTLTSGLVDIGNNNFVFGASASVAGAPSATSMIVATGSGQVQKMFTAGTGFTFPVGDNTGSAEYSPVTLSFTGGTFAAGAYAGVNLVNAKYPGDPNTTAYLNRYWNISQTGISLFNCNATFSYPAGDVTGTESQIYAVRMTPAPTVTYNPANATLHQLTASGLTSFGTYTGSIVNTPLTLTVYLQGLYAGGGTMNNAWSFDGVNFTPKWGAGVADHITVEIHDATTYAVVKKVVTDVPLNVNGTALVNIPGLQNGNYYITVKHRNSIETVSATAQVFTGAPVSYNFSDAAAKAYGSNLKAMAGGVFAVYTGDIADFSSLYPGIPVQDGIIDILDLYYLYPSYLAGDLGYLPSDLNGDGVVDVLDLYLGYDNYILGIYAITPP